MTAPRRDCPRCAGAGWIRLTVAWGDREVTTELSRPACCAPSPAVLRRWRAAHGWTPDTELCGTCGRPTHCQDDTGVPRHLHCSPRIDCPSQLELLWPS